MKLLKKHHCHWLRRIQDVGNASIAGLTNPVIAVKTEVFCKALQKFNNVEDLNDRWQMKFIVEVCRAKNKGGKPLRLHT